jgi:hypothetical protein
MPKRVLQQWTVGAVFAVPQLDNQFCLGQVLDLPLPNVPSCAFYNIRFSQGAIPSECKFKFDKLIAALSTTREQLDQAAWKVTGVQTVALERQFWPNEQLRELGWVGAKTYGAGIINRFLNAFYGLAPWDFYPDSILFEKMLFTPHRKPRKLVYKNEDM